MQLAVQTWSLKQWGSVGVSTASTGALDQDGTVLAG